MTKVKTSSRRWVSHFIHGLTRQGDEHPLYRVYMTMLARCYNPNNHKFHLYGGRGITVCKRWQDSVVHFILDMGDRPTAKHSLGRIDNDGHYTPENCRWETITQQARNRRDNHVLEFKGRRATIVEWSERTGIKQATIRKRVNDYGWTVKDSLTRPARKTCRVY